MVNSKFKLKNIIKIFKIYRKNLPKFRIKAILKENLPKSRKNKKKFRNDI